MNSAVHSPATTDTAKVARYPGASPFGDTSLDQRIFCGRDQERVLLTRRVLGSKLLVLFGASGAGKTSLLRAGLFRPLRDKEYLPLPLSVAPRGNVCESVIAALRGACADPANAGVELTEGDPRDVWTFLQTTLVWKGEMLLTPVLVFDQLEEIFIHRDETFRRELADLIGALVSGVAIPAHNRESAARADVEVAPAATVGPRAQHGGPAPRVKIVLSISEEYLGALEELSPLIPGLFQDRVRLSGLTDTAAKQAICEPAAMTDDGAEFASPRFTLEEAALRALLEFLLSRATQVEPFQLQLLCRHAEQAATAKAQRLAHAGKPAEVAPASTPTAEPSAPMLELTLDDLGGSAAFAGVLQNFYRDVTAALPWRQRRRVRRLCEEGLLSTTGSRQLLEEGEIFAEYGVTRAQLEQLVQARLLHREQRLESMFYEIGHERLAASIVGGRGFRVPRRVRYMLWGAASVALFTIGFLSWSNWQINQERLAADRARFNAEQERLTADRARSDAEDLVAFLLGESLLEKLRPVGRNAILEEVQAKVQVYLAKTPDQNQAGQLRTRGLALRNEGDILRSRGRLAEAIATFQASAAVFERLANAAPENADPKAEQARTFDRLGDALLDQGRITESLKTHRKALALRQTLYDNGDHGVETTMDLADSNSSVGQMLNHMGQPGQALVHLDRAHKLLQPMQASASHSPRLFKARHNAIDNRAKALELIGDAPRARDAYADAQNITQDWIQDQPLSADARGRHVIAVSRLANAQMDQGAFKKALERYVQINHSVSELVRWDDTNAIWRRDFAATLILVAEAKAALKYDQEAQQAYGKALELLKSLAEIDPSNLSLNDDLSWFYQSRGKLALQHKEWQRATEAFTASERYAAKAARADQALVTWQRNWSTVFYCLARASTGAGDAAQASAFLGRGREMISTLMKAVPEMTVVLRQDLATFDEPWRYRC